MSANTKNNEFSSLTNPLLHIVLDRPKIAANIASIVRLSVGTACALHVCGPLVFDKTDKTKWRAGLDYFWGARVHFHKSLERCLGALNKKNIYLVEVGSNKAPWDAKFNPGDIIILGPEDGSIKQNIQEKYKDNILTLPQLGPVRSLNLAQVTCTAVFEAMRQSHSVCD